MTDLNELLTTISWPVAVVISSVVIGQAMIAIARAGIKVEIATKRPILISTGLTPLRAEVDKVRI
ncbi:MAG: hypothetical protein CL862_00050 [Cyanobium sp. NAT70]|jgi:hypothetical protein|nr:hypothetical protein [Cyanobium sp. NAT70]|tara:strand:+ start:374 stop:568 length:195 start_codon:yes stop_codon:yes gene_type:complete